MSCYFPLGTMLSLLWVVLCVLQFMFHMAGGCAIEERIALMRIRSSLLEANSEVPASWGQSGDCCSWERVRCNNSTRMSVLNSTRRIKPTERKHTTVLVWAPTPWILWSFRKSPSRTYTYNLIFKSFFVTSNSQAISKQSKWNVWFLLATKLHHAEEHRPVKECWFGYWCQVLGICAKISTEKTNALWM